MKTNTQQDYNLEEMQDRIKQYMKTHSPYFTPDPAVIFDELQQVIQNILNAGQMKSRDVSALMNKYPALHEKVFWQLSKKYWHASVTNNTVPSKSDVVVDTFSVLRKLYNKMRPAGAVRDGVVIPTLSVYA